MRKVHYSIFPVLFACFIIVTTFPLVSNDYHTFISNFDKELKAELTSEKRVYSFFFDTPHLDLLPQNEMSPTIRQSMKKLKPTLGVEAVMLYNKQKTKENNSQKQNLLPVYNTLRAVSTLEGIKYYSISKSRERVLFRSSYLIESPDNLKPLPDSLVKDIPKHDSMFLFQEDTSFGKNINKIFYSKGTDSIHMSIINQQTIHYFGIIPAVGSDNMEIHISVTDTGSHLLFYGTALVKTLNLPFFKERIKNSLSNRIKALYSWFINEYENRIKTDNEIKP